MIKAESKRPIAVPKQEDRDEALYDSDGDVDIEVNAVDDTEPKGRNLSKKDLKK